MSGELVVQLLGIEHQLEAWKSHVVGRDPSADITISDRSVSRRHLILTYEGSVWVAQDLESTNGTFLDGSMVDRVTIDRPVQLNLGGPSGTPLGLAPDSATTAGPISSMTEPSRPHHFLIVDVVGSTELWDRLPEAMHENIRSLQRVTRRVVRDHHGVVFKTLGDGSCSVFPLVGDALAAALELVDLLAETLWEGGVELAVRVAVHTGEAARYGADLLGQGVNEAAKLCDAAESGEILISERSLGLVDELPEGVDFRDSPACNIPGVANPIGVRTVVHT